MQMMNWWSTQRSSPRSVWGTLLRSHTPLMSTGEVLIMPHFIQVYRFYYSTLFPFTLFSPLLLQVKSLKEDLQKGKCFMVCFMTVYLKNSIRKCWMLLWLFYITHIKKILGLIHGCVKGTSRYSILHHHFKILNQSSS